MCLGLIIIFCSGQFCSGKFFFRVFFPCFFFTWQELFFATLDDWHYWQKGDKEERSWTNSGEEYNAMLKWKKSKGQQRVRRGIAKGYSTTQRAALASDATGPPYSKAAAAAPAAETTATPDPIDVDAIGAPEAAAAVPEAAAADAAVDAAQIAAVPESKVPRGVLALAKRGAHENTTNTPFMQPYGFRPVSRFFLGERCLPQVFFFRT